jgi:Ca-activated chloride channel family protein
VSGFAVWDGVTRIPGVILERRRAEEIYDRARLQVIDPGLLQQGESDGGGAVEATRTSVFSARVVPIPGYGTKRLELEYHETVPVENLRSAFALPLRPDAYNAQTARRLRIAFSLSSAHAIRDFQVTGTSYPLAITAQTPTRVAGTFTGENVTFSEDFSVEFGIDPAAADTLAILTHRNPAPALPGPADTAPRAAAPRPGFFQASALLAPGAASTGAAAAPRTIVALFDTSLSMTPEKLDRSFRALETALLSLRPADHFNLSLFNSETTLFSPSPVAADTAAVERALAFVRAGRLRGGTDLQAALDLALRQADRGTGDRYLLVLSDASGTQGTIANARLATWYAGRRASLAADRRPRTYLFGVGDDTNVPLLRMLSQDQGLMEMVRSTEPIDFKLRAFLSRIGARPVENLQLRVDPASAVDLVYPLDPITFGGSVATWVGQYATPAARATFTARGVRDGRAVEMRADAPLPAESPDHEDIGRRWARARVDALLDAIARNGEDRATVDEIIRLAREHTFVTPYTSFLAAPRALLRPRVIKPGDPVLRVATDASITSVTALFPFGLIKPLRYLDDEDVWQTRFLAPVHMTDGTYEVRLVMRDREGRMYRESKSFVIASQPPTLRVSLPRTSARRGETIRIRADASKTTRTIVARLYGAAPVDLHWNPAEKVSTGTLTIPVDLAPGEYVLRVIAEDMAHNVAAQEVTVDVLP